MDTILIVDDSAFIVEGLIAFLKKKYHPLAAHGGEECLEILTHESPSVIILDIMMEPMDGWETLARIKENPKTRHIPVLMFSAIKISPLDAEEHKISIDDCLTKPVSPNKIIEAIEKVLARRDTNRVVVERWQSAGISQEKIDEYLSLVTNLEVDLSLCQNMKIQSDLVQPRDKNQDEFNAVMKAIEERILLERDQIEALAREMNDTLGQTPADTGTEAVPESGSRPEIFVPSGPDTQPGTAESIAEGSPVDERVPDTPPLSQTGPDEVPPATLPVETDPSSESAEITVPMADTQREKGEVSEKIGTAPAPGLPGSESGEADNTSLIGPESLSSSGALPHSPALPASDLHVAEKRNVIPADPDIPPARSGTASLTGAGTDVPMPWNHLIERTPQRIITEMEEKTGILAPEPVSPPRGILARVISFVQSFFGKRK
jgi:two-component system, OmpR family, response regulator